MVYVVPLHQIIVLRHQRESKRSLHSLFFLVKGKFRRVTQSSGSILFLWGIIGQSGSSWHFKYQKKQHPQVIPPDSPISVSANGVLTGRILTLGEWCCHLWSFNPLNINFLSLSSCASLYSGWWGPLCELPEATCFSLSAISSFLITFIFSFSLCKMSKQQNNCSVISSAFENKHHSLDFKDLP